MSVIEYAKNLMLLCPVINIMKTNGANENKDMFSIEPEPTDPIVKRYFKGEAKKRFSFSLSTWGDSFTEDERVKNYELYEKLVNWAQKLSRTREFPPMNVRQNALGLNILSNVYAMDEAADGNRMFYLIQCELIYFEKGE